MSTTDQQFYTTAHQPQWYFIAKSWNVGALPEHTLPRKFRKGQSDTFTLDLAPTEHQRRDGILRLMTQQNSSSYRWTAAWNGKKLTPAAFVAKPLDHPYAAALGQPDQYACFRCPRSSVDDGLNKLTITLGTGGPVTVQYIDLVLP